VHRDGIDAFGNRNPMRPSHELAAVDHVIDLVDGEHQMLPPVADHGCDRVGARVRRPGVSAVMEVVEAQRWVVDKRGRDLLAEGGHKAKLRLPIVQEHLVKLGRLDAADEHREAMLCSESRHEQFVVPSVRILPEPHVGVCERLVWVVCGDTRHRDPVSEFAGQQFLEQMVVAHETTEYGNASLDFGGGG